MDPRPPFTPRVHPSPSGGCAEVPGTAARSAQWSDDRSRLRDAAVVRLVLCDDDELMVGPVEDLIVRLGHELVGVAETTAGSIGLIQHAKPHVVVIDPAIGYNSDFDVIDAAIDAGAVPVIFSHGAGGLALGRYERRPLLVEKPDLVGLEQTIARLDLDETDQVVAQERRQRPIRAAGGAPSTSASDAMSFYEALNDIRAGDALLSIELPSEDRHGAAPLGEVLLPTLRPSDRLVATAASVRILLPAGGREGVESMLRRIVAVTELPAGTVVRSVVVTDGEPAMGAFDRLKRGDTHDLPGLG